MAGRQTLDFLECEKGSRLLEAGFQILKDQLEILILILVLAAADYFVSPLVPLLGLLA